MSKPWSDADKLWDFGMLQAKIWVSDDTLCWKASGTSNSYPLHSITDATYRAVLNGKIDIYSGGAKVHTITVPTHRQDLANEVVDFLRSQANGSAASLTQSKLDALERLASLRERGAITGEEFEREKKKII